MGNAGDAESAARDELGDGRAPRGRGRRAELGLEQVRWMKPLLMIRDTIDKDERRERAALLESAFPMFPALSAAPKCS